MIKKRFTIDECGNITDTITNRTLYVENRYTECNYYVNLLNKLNDENNQLKKDLKRCKDWINSDKNDYELTLAFIKNKGYSLKDVLEYEKRLSE
jgi:uncharacterized protein YmfQ (DUF2313 family)